MGLTTNRPRNMFTKRTLLMHTCENYMNNENFIFAQQNYRMIRIIILKILNHLKYASKTWAIIKSPKSYDSKTWALFFAFFFSTNWPFCSDATKVLTWHWATTCQMAWPGRWPSAWTPWCRSSEAADLKITGGYRGDGRDDGFVMALWWG